MSAKSLSTWTWCQVVIDYADMVSAWSLTTHRHQIIGLCVFIVVDYAGHSNIKLCNKKSYLSIDNISKKNNNLFMKIDKKYIKIIF